MVFHGKLNLFFEKIYRLSGHCVVKCVRHSVYHRTIYLEDVWLYSDQRFSLGVFIYSSIRYINNFWTKNLSFIIFNIICIHHIFQLISVYIHYSSTSWVLHTELDRHKIPGSRPLNGVRFALFNVYLEVLNQHNTCALLYLIINILNSAFCFKVHQYFFLIKLF